MLNAIFYGKAGRVENNLEGQSVSWRQLFQKREDLLTSTFFSRFSYLSPLMQHRLLKHWFNGKGDFTSFKSIEYWPKYELPHIDDRDFVEPDVLLRFADFDVMIEVKPPQGGDQYLKQWQLEIEGYLSAESNVKSLWFLAIGRLNSATEKWCTQLMESETFSPDNIAAIKWKSIAMHISSLIKSGEPLCQDYHILNDLLKALSLYGIRSRDLHWKEMNKLKLNSSLSLEKFKRWPLKK